MYLSELQEGRGCIKNLHYTPYANLAILFDHDRKALIKIEDGKYSFLKDNWFDDIDGFEYGLYAKVRLGNHFNLILPTGEYLFPDWKGDIVIHGQNLIFCYKVKNSDKILDQHENEKVCSIYDRRGQLLLENILVLTDFVNGESIVSKDGMYNYINENGKLLMNDWLLEACAFDNTYYGVFAFVKDEKGWSIVDINGDYLCSQRYTAIRKAGCHYRCNSQPIAIVEEDKGQNILMSKGNRNNSTGSLILGFRDSVESIALVGTNDIILAKQNGIWNLYKWDDRNCYFDFEKELGEFEVISEALHGARIIRKGDIYNIVDSNGVHFDEWYSEILVIGNLLRVRREKSSLPLDKSELDTYDIQRYEYNLLRYDGSYVLDEWAHYITATPVNDYLIINIRPTITTRSDGVVIDQSITYSYDNSTGNKNQIISSVKGCCNILSKILLFDDWFDSIEFLNGNVFTDGYVKVWKNGKSNLINKNKEYASPIWVDAFKLPWRPSSYFSTIIERSYEVLNDGKVNLLKNGKFIFSQWFTDIVGKEKDDYYRVRNNGLEGLFSVKNGLFAGRFFSSIKGISDTLFLGRDTSEGLILNSSGEVVSRGPIVSVNHFKDGYAKIFTGDPNKGEWRCKFNFINISGEIVSPVWFDYDRDQDYKEEHGWMRDRPTPSFTIVSKDKKYNLITPDKSIVFNNWYDSISGQDGKWLVSDESNGVAKYTFIDNNEHRLTDDWFNNAYTLRNFEPGVFVVERDGEYNVFNIDNEYSFSKWTSGRIIDYSGLVVAPINYQYHYWINSKGYLISPFFGRANFPAKAFNHTCGDNCEDILILDLFDKDDNWMQLICRHDGTPLLYKKNNQEKNYSSAPYGVESIFRDINEFFVPGKGQFLLADKHWAVRNKDKGQYVIMDFEGNVLSEEFETINKFDEDGFSCVMRDGLYNIINSDFHLVSSIWFSSVGFEYKSQETEYEECLDESGMVYERECNVERIRRNTSFIDGYLKVEVLGAYNYMNQSGHFRFPIWYDSVYDIAKGYYKVSLNGKYNLIDSYGTPILDTWFDRMSKCARDYRKVIYACRKDDLLKLLIINDDLACLSDVWVDKVFRYDKVNGYYSVRLRGKKNFITDDGKLLMPEWYDDQVLFWDDSGVFVVVKNGGKYNIYSSSKGKLVSSDGFDNVLRGDGQLFNYGWCGVQIEEKFTFVNENGELISDSLYDSIRAFRCGYAGVVKDGKRNFLSKDGKLLSKIWFDEISCFTEYGKAIVKVNGCYNIIDDSCNMLIPDEVSPVSSIVFKNSKYCILNFDTKASKRKKVYFDFKTAHTHDDERQVKKYLDILEKNECHFKGAENNGDPGNDNPDCAKLREQIALLRENGGIQGINYTLVNFGKKSNLLDKNGSLLFEEWMESSSIEMCQGVPLMLDADNNWVVVK